MRIMYICSFVLACAVCAFPMPQELTIEVKDYAPLPVTGLVDGAGNGESSASLQV